MLIELGVPEPDGHFPPELDGHFNRILRQGYIAILVVFAPPDMDHHPLRIKVTLS